VKGNRKDRRVIYVFKYFTTKVFQGTIVVCPPCARHVATAAGVVIVVYAILTLSVIVSATLICVSEVLKAVNDEMEGNDTLS
jgi:hypothetical protein